MKVGQDENKRKHAGQQRAKGREHESRKLKLGKRKSRKK